MNYKERFTQLFEHKMSDEAMREFLVALKLDEHTSVNAIAIAAEVMRQHAIALPISEELRQKSIDIVGTGGDKIGSFNISSTSALVAASCGASVAKHGNRSITSKSGSADLLEELGIRLDLNLEQSAKLLEESGFTFMFAQNHHPAMRFIGPVRKSIDDKTIFNILGPLTNPAGISKYMLGVFDESFVPKMLEALKINGATSALVVSSNDGMDEIGLSGVTYASQLRDGVVHEFEIDPQEYGIKLQPLGAILGGDVKQNAQITYNILNNEATEAQRDIVVLNVAASLMVDGIARDIQDGLDMAREAILLKRAKRKLEQIVEISNKL